MRDAVLHDFFIQPGILSRSPLPQRDFTKNGASHCTIASVGWALLSALALAFGQDTVLGKWDFGDDASGLTRYPYSNVLQERRVNVSKRVGSITF